MANLNFTEALSELKRRSKLQGRPASTREISAVSQGYFDAQAGRKLQAAQLAQHHQEFEESMALEQSRFKEEKKAAREARRSEERQNIISYGIIGGGILNWGSGGGLLGGGCLVVSACTSPDSPEVGLAREYRDSVMLPFCPVALGGYYRLSHVIVPHIHSHKWVKKLVRKCLVDRMMDYAQVALGKKEKRKLWTSWIVTESFLTLCCLIGSRINYKGWIALHN